MALEIVAISEEEKKKNENQKTFSSANPLDVKSIDELFTLFFPPGHEDRHNGKTVTPATMNQADINKAYKLLSLQYHPDKKSESEKADAEVNFKKIPRLKEIIEGLFNQNEELLDLFDNTSSQTLNNLLSNPKVSQYNKYNINKKLSEMKSQENVFSNITKIEEELELLKKSNWNLFDSQNKEKLDKILGKASVTSLKDLLQKNNISSENKIYIRDIINQKNIFHLNKAKKIIHNFIWDEENKEIPKEVIDAFNDLIVYGNNTDLSLELTKLLYKIKFENFEKIFSDILKSKGNYNYLFYREIIEILNIKNLLPKEFRTITGREPQEKFIIGLGTLSNEGLIAQLKNQFIKNPKNLADLLKKIISSKDVFIKNFLESEDSQNLSNKIREGITEILSTCFYNTLQPQDQQQFLSIFLMLDETSRNAIIDSQFKLQYGIRNLNSLETDIRNHKNIHPALRRNILDKITETLTYKKPIKSTLPDKNNDTESLELAKNNLINNFFASSPEYIQRPLQLCTDPNLAGNVAADFMRLGNTKSTEILCEALYAKDVNTQIAYLKAFKKIDPAFLNEEGKKLYDSLKSSLQINIFINMLPSINEKIESSSLSILQKNYLLDLLPKIDEENSITQDQINKSIAKLFAYIITCPNKEERGLAEETVSKILGTEKEVQKAQKQREGFVFSALRWLGINFQDPVESIIKKSVNKSENKALKDMLDNIKKHCAGAIIFSVLNHKEVLNAETAAEKSIATRQTFDEQIDIIINNSVNPNTLLNKLLTLRDAICNQLKQPFNLPRPRVEHLVDILSEAILEYSNAISPRTTHDLIHRLKTELFLHYKSVEDPAVKHLLKQSLNILSDATNNNEFRTSKDSLRQIITRLGLKNDLDHLKNISKKETKSNIFTGTSPVNKNHFNNTHSNIKNSFDTAISNGSDISTWNNPVSKMR